MESVLKDFILTVSTAILGLLGAFIVYFINKATAKLKAETEKIKNDNQKVLVDNAIDRINVLVNKAVVATNETTAKALKQSIVDGKVDREELVKLSTQVADEVYNQMSPNIINLAQTEITDVKGYILNQIEEEVKGLK